jgi:hypothetical protein
VCPKILAPELPQAPRPQYYLHLILDHLENYSVLDAKKTVYSILRSIYSIFFRMKIDFPSLEESD